MVSILVNNYKKYAFKLYYNWNENHSSITHISTPHWFFLRQEEAQAGFQLPAFCLPQCWNFRHTLLWLALKHIFLRGKCNRNNHRRILAFPSYLSRSCSCFSRASFSAATARLFSARALSLASRRFLKSKHAFRLF